MEREILGRVYGIRQSSDPDRNSFIIVISGEKPWL